MDYRIQPGDTLTAIAARFNVGLGALESANPQVADPNLIFPNDIVHIPAPHGHSEDGSHGSPHQLMPVPPHVITYVVQPGDTLSGIAAAHNLTLAAIEAANPQITNPSVIHPGQIVNLTGAASTQRRTTGAGGTGGTSAAAAISIDTVSYTLYTGAGDVASWTNDACAALDLPAPQWITGYQTLCRRESSGRANAINAWDCNAHGPIQADGYPLHCSRGAAQCIPDTFAANHAPRTSTSIYNPVANIAASINYVIARYGVAHSGANLASRVQQADPNRPPMGY